MAKINDDGGQTGPSKILNRAPQSPDIEVTTQRDEEKRQARNLGDALKVTGQSVYTRRGKR
jgi:hypothetical protein